MGRPEAAGTPQARPRGTGDPRARRRLQSTLGPARRRHPLAHPLPHGSENAPARRSSPFSFDGATLTYHKHGSELHPAPTASTSLRWCAFGVISCHDARRPLGLCRPPAGTGSATTRSRGWTWATVRCWAATTPSGAGSPTATRSTSYTPAAARRRSRFRNRDPLSCPRRPRGLCVLRGTRAILMPETGLDLGGGLGGRPRPDRDLGRRLRDGLARRARRTQPRPPGENPLGTPQPPCHTR